MQFCDAQKMGIFASMLDILAVQATYPFKHTVPNSTIHQVTTMLATSKNVVFPGNNYLLTTGTDDPSLAGAWAIIKMSCYQYPWLAGGWLWPGNRTFLEVASMVVTWWIVAFMRSDKLLIHLNKFTMCAPLSPYFVYHAK